MGSYLTIGKVASAAGVSVETIRYYERLNLLQRPPRPPGGVRHYPDTTVAQIRFIKRAQELGFSLAEVGHLLDLQKWQSCSAARSLASEKLAAVEARLVDLMRLRGVLAELIERCDAQRCDVSCPIIESLQHS